MNRMVHGLLVMKTFEQGIHPEYSKITANLKIIEAVTPQKVIIPLHQHTGATCEPLVNVGDLVVEGQKIGDSSKFISAPVHSSIAGKVTKIDKFPHPCGVDVLSIVIESHHTEEENRETGKPRNLDQITPDEIRQIVREAGIVGLGGAAFPTHVKLCPPKDKQIDTILINGCECEPYITTDHRIMIERAADILSGAKYATIATGATRVIVGVESNKKDAIKQLRTVIRAQHVAWATDGVDVVELETKYPQGGEKMLIKAILDKEVPSCGLPLDVGVVVVNVGTAVAIAEAINLGKALTQRVVTVTGSGIKEPKNLLVRVGTTFQEIVNQCGGLTEDAAKVIMGGPMMGVAQYSLEVPIVKATCCILVLTKAEALEQKVYPCIKCSKCLSYCPMNLMPTRLAAFAENGKYSEFEQWGGLDCMECGCCAYVCPSKIPLVQWIKLAKLKLRQMK